MAKKEKAPAVPAGFKYCPSLARAATAWDLKKAARHRWFYFPHSYSPRLVYEILDYWDIPRGSILADNFVGCGTTMLAARERGLSAVGFDLSPLAVTVSNTKINCYDSRELSQSLQMVLRSYRQGDEQPRFQDRLLRAFTNEELREIYSLSCQINHLRYLLRDFFLLALISTARIFSRAVPDGGWFRWANWPNRSEEIRAAFESRVSEMIADVDSYNWDYSIPAQASMADARKLPLEDGSVDALVTSPPYANRHDYSRIFHIDLLLLGLDEAQVTRLRHESIRSHVESLAPTGYDKELANYREAESLRGVLNSLPADADSRIEPLLKGYFEDLYMSLVEVGRVLRLGGRAAYVVGNVRHAGVMIPVDEILAGLAPQTGLVFDTGWVVRFRGNSAQQMGRYGREPSRESVILFSKDTRQCNCG